MKHDENLRNINIYKSIKWGDKIFCSECHSREVKSVEDLPVGFHTHECLECGETFYIDGDIGIDYIFNHRYSEKRAMEIFREIRWGNKVYCPKCHSTDKLIGNSGNQTKEVNGKTVPTEVKKYECKNKKCKEKYFSDLKYTPFADGKIPMDGMFYLLSNIGVLEIKKIASAIEFKPKAVEKKIKIFEHFFKNEKKQQELFRSVKACFLANYITEMSKEEDFPENIVKDQEKLFKILLWYNLDVLEKFNLERKE